MIINDYFSGDGSSTWFVLSGNPIDPSQVQVTVNDGTMVYGQNFVINGLHYLGFIEAPNQGENNIHAEYDGIPHG